MRILKNVTKNNTIADKVEIAETFFHKTRGLMFRKDFNHALVFILNEESRINASIHMFFVFFPIDLVYLDKDKKVVDIYENVKPFTCNITPKKLSSFIVELPAGAIKAKRIGLGDTLKW